ncbi:MAG: hypothetical protein NC331_09765 [Lachnospiraceae bacterium]|nr:hypothetical protein [Lachnospiraceae bacterium]MCM1239658.1 hypothetical protein [Lachnospiraceae bacterium]
MEDLRATGVVLFGGGRLGKQMLNMLEKLDIKVLQVWDRNANNMNNVSQIMLPDYDYADKDIPIIICVYSKMAAEGIEEKLHKHGFTRVFHYEQMSLRELLGCAKKETYDMRECNKCMLNGGGCKEYESYLQQGTVAHIPLRTLNVNITSKCTLNCVHCAELEVEFRKRRMEWGFEKAAFLRSMDALEDIFGYIRSVTLLGGEFCLNDQWRTILDRCVQSSCIGYIVITTNGIYRLQEQDYDLLNHDKIVVLLDDYTTHLSEHQKHLFHDNIEMFQKKSVNYVVLDNTLGTWYDFGEIRDYGDSRELLVQKYQRCTLSDCYCLLPDDYFAICGRQYFAWKLDKVNTMLVDSVRLDTKNIEQTRDAIRNLMNQEYLAVCQYCRGCEEPITPGLQDTGSGINR